MLLSSFLEEGGPTLEYSVEDLTYLCHCMTEKGKGYISNSWNQGSTTRYIFSKWKLSCRIARDCDVRDIPTPRGCLFLGPNTAHELYFCYLDF